MKISAYQYAKALYESTEGKSQSEIDEVVLNFARMATKNSQLKNIDKIIENFTKIWNKKNSVIEAKVASGKKLDNVAEKTISDFIKKKYGAKEVVLNKVVDESLKGGCRIRIDDEMIDFSIARQLANLKKELEK